MSVHFGSIVVTAFKLRGPMSGEFDDFKDDEVAEVMAAQLIEAVKSLNLNHLRMPLIDDSSVWEVSVKRMGIESCKKPDY
jgi:hypothetical protein